MTGGADRDKFNEMAARLRQAVHDEKPPAETPKSDADGFKGSQLGVGIIATVAVCVGAGWLFDHFLGTGPWGIVVMVCVGLALGMYGAYRATSRMDKGT